MSEHEEGAEVISLDALMSGPMDKTAEQEREEIEKSIGDELEGKKESDDFTENFLKEKGDEEEEEEQEGKDLIVDKEEQEKKPAKEVTPDLYRDAITSIFGEGQTFIQEDEDGNDVEVSIDDMELTPQTIKDLIESKISAEREKALEGKISIEGTSDMILDIIEIEKNGGQIGELLQYKQAYTDPLDRIDLSTENGQMQAVELYLRGRQEKDDEIDMRIEIYKKKGILEEKAKEFDTEIRESIKAHATKLKTEAEESAKKRHELFKEYKKELNEELVTKYEMKEAVRKKLVDLATKKGEDGEYEIDKLYKASRSKPEDVALLTLFFSDREEFIRHLSSKTINRQRLKDQTVIRLGTNKKSYEVSKKESGKADKDIISLDSLK